MYAQKIEGDSWLGEKLDGGKIDRMSGTNLGFYWPRSEQHSNNFSPDQQLGQLYELMQAIQKREREGSEDDS